MVYQILVFFVGFVAAWFYEQIMLSVFGGNGLIVWNWRLHHSLYGLLFISLGVITRKTPLISFGVGIIAQHTLTDGFWFITKESVK